MSLARDNLWDLVSRGNLMSNRAFFPMLGVGDLKPLTRGKKMPEFFREPKIETYLLRKRRIYLRSHGSSAQSRSTTGVGTSNTQWQVATLARDTKSLLPKWRCPPPPLPV